MYMQEIKSVPWTASLPWTEDDQACLLSIVPLIKKRLPEIHEELYQRIKVILPADASGEQKAALGDFREYGLKHWDNLLSGILGADYEESAKTTGHTFSVLRLKTSVIFGLYAVFCGHFSQIIGDHLAHRLWCSAKQKERNHATLRTATRLLFIDMNFVLAAHYDAVRNRKSQQTDTLLNAFDHSMAALFRELVGSSDTAAVATQEAMSASTGLSGTAQIASQNVNMVAAAAEELSSSIHEIDAQVKSSGHIVKNVVEKSAATSVLLRRLQDCAAKISDFTDLIRTIAEQTNLLGLNATIEAARAGEYGRGFGVVAAEVKNLSHQTALATTEISSQVSAVQEAINDTVSAMEDINSTIIQMNSVANAVTMAVGDQTVAMNEITRSIQFAADSAEKVTTISMNVTEKLRAQVDIFLSSIKAKM